MSITGDNEGTPLGPRASTSAINKSIGSVTVTGSDRFGENEDLIVSGAPDSTGPVSHQRAFRRRRKGKQRAPDRGEVRDRDEDEHEQARKVAQRYSLARFVTLAVERAMNFERCRREDDPIDSASAGADLSSVLDSLWELRDLREPEWGSVLNSLQGSMQRLTLEVAPLPQVEAIVSVIRDTLAGGEVDAEDEVAARMRLRSTGLDPWEGVSHLDDNAAARDDDPGSKAP